MHLAACSSFASRLQARVNQVELGLDVLKALPDVLTEGFELFAHLAGFRIEVLLELFEARLKVFPCVLGIHPGQVQLHFDFIRCAPEVAAGFLQLLLQRLLCFVRAHGGLL